MPPLISVLLPALNAQPTLALAIRSVLEQTLPDFELLLLDDRSTDRTVEITRSFCDSRIRIVPAEGPPGLVSRLNQGIALASGAFIARMDADDVSFPDRFGKQIAFLRSNPATDLVGTRALAFDDAEKPLGTLPFRATHEEICARPWLGFYLAHPTWMGHSDWFRRHWYRVPEIHRAEDQELLLRAMPESRYAAIPEILLGYRCRPVNRNALTNARAAWRRAQVQTFVRRSQYGWAACAFTAGIARSLADRTLPAGRPWPKVDPALSVSMSSAFERVLNSCASMS